MRKGLVLVVMCVAMLFAAAPSVSAQAPNDEYKATLEKMLELSGSMASAKAMVPQMIAMLKQQSPSASTAFWDGFQKKWETKFGSKLAELYAPVYQKYLTLDDLKKIVAFYETPVGKYADRTTAGHGDCHRTPERPGCTGKQMIISDFFDLSINEPYYKRF